MMKNDLVVLDVGGKLFCTTVSTLSLCGSTYFSSLLSKNWLESAKQDDESFPNADRSEINKRPTIFIDRDPTIFHLILSYLRGLKLHIPENLPLCELEQLADEADYYMLNDLCRQVHIEIQNKKEVCMILYEYEFDYL